MIFILLQVKRRVWLSFSILLMFTDESKQIILTSDRYPKELTELDPRLVSFFMGIVGGVEPPDIETRIEILLKKAENSGADLPLQLCPVYCPASGCQQCA